MNHIERAKSLGCKIIYEYPPIPYRGWDWCAHVEDDPELGTQGHGKTEEEAAIMWLEWWDEAEPSDFVVEEYLGEPAETERERFNRIVEKGW